MTHDTRDYTFRFDGPANSVFEYYTMSITVPEPIQYDAYKVIQPWPFNKPDLIGNLLVKLVKPLEYININIVIDKDENTNCLHDLP